MLSEQDRKGMLSLARRNILHFLREGKILDVDFDGEYRKKCGIFVTLKKKGELRGCIGIPEPIIPLGQALLDSSISAATRDPRFPPIDEKELEECAIEITVLQPPHLFEGPPRDLPKKVIVGKHGLIVEGSWNKGLLLPQVAVEWGWGAEEFLSQTCWKAGLPPDAWLDEKTKVYFFEGEAFGEE